MGVREVDDPDLVVRVLERHALLCPVCGYDVRSLSVPICPECGSRLRLRLGSPDLRIHHLVAASVGVAIGVGFNANIGLMLAIQAMRQPGGAAAIPWTAAYGLVTSALLVMGLVLLVRFWRRFLAWPGTRQRLVALGCVLVSVACAAGLVSLLAVYVF